MSELQKTHVVSAFWETMDCSYKEMYKEHARCINISDRLTGKRRMTGFWRFRNWFLDNACEPIDGNEFIGHTLWLQMNVAEVFFWSRAELKTAMEQRKVLEERMENVFPESDIIFF